MTSRITMDVASKATANSVISVVVRQADRQALRRAVEARTGSPAVLLTGESEFVLGFMRALQT